MRALRFAAAGAATCLLVAVYYWFPLSLFSADHPVRRWVGLVLILVLLSVTVIAQVRAVAKAPLDEMLAGIPLVVALTVLTFASIDYVVASTAGQFADLKNRTDALYFTVETLSTVGYGDIHAQGEQARVLVTLQMMFNLVFVATAVAVGTARMRSRLTTSAATDR